MSRHTPFLALLGLLALLVAGLAALFQRRVAQGDVFPVYSSLRSDPLGVRALHDALAEMPGLKVERQYRTIRDDQTAPVPTIIYAGLPYRAWSRLTREEIDPLDAIVRRGGRLVLALRADAARTKEELESERRAEAERQSQEEKARGGKPAAKTIPVDLRRRWGAEPRERVPREREAGAAATPEALALGLPDAVGWRSELTLGLDAEAEWRVIYRRNGEPVLAERRLGGGTLVLITDSYFLSNEALQKERSPTLLAWVIGSQRRVVFDETHLGVVAQPGVAALARRYGLSGAFGLLLILAILFVWRQTLPLVPPVEAPPDLALGYHPAAGLEALLRRSVTVAELPAACLEEWRVTAPASERARVDAALAALPANASAVVRYNAATQSLRKTAIVRPTNFSLS
jgi:hypothetical protein